MSGVHFLQQNVSNRITFKWHGNVAGAKLSKYDNALCFSSWVTISNFPHSNMRKFGVILRSRSTLNRCEAAIRKCFNWKKTKSFQESVNGVYSGLFVCRMASLIVGSGNSKQYVMFWRHVSHGRANRSKLLCVRRRATEIGPVSGARIHNKCVALL